MKAALDTICESGVINIRIVERPEAGVDHPYAVGCQSVHGV